MWILIFGYASIYTLTLLWFISFPLYFEDDVECAEEHYWIAVNEKAGLLALIKSILLICPTLILWLTFFYQIIFKIFKLGLNIKYLKMNICYCIYVQCVFRYLKKFSMYMFPSFHI